MNDRIVITVIGTDKSGIVANVSTKLSELNLNIIDIKGLQEKFKDVEEKIGVRVYLQHENIFKAMHRI